MASTPTSCDSTMMFPRRSPEHRLDGRLELGRGLHDVGHQAPDGALGGPGPHLADPILSRDRRPGRRIRPDRRRPSPAAGSVLLHDGPDAALKALVAGLDLAQRLEPRATAVRLLAQGVELDLPAGQVLLQRWPTGPRPPRAGPRSSRSARAGSTSRPWAADSSASLPASGRGQAGVLLGAAGQPLAQLVAAGGGCLDLRLQSGHLLQGGAARRPWPGPGARRVSSSRLRSSSWLRIEGLVGLPPLGRPPSRGPARWTAGPRAPGWPLRSAGPAPRSRRPPPSNARSARGPRRRSAGRAGRPGRPGCSGRTARPWRRSAR